MAENPSLEDFQRLYQSISRASSQSQLPVQQQIPEGYRQATKYEKGLGDILKIGQTLSDLTGWNQRYQELKEQRLQANPNEKWYTTLAHGIAADPLGFALNLPGQTIGAPAFGINEALEAITGTPYTEAYDGLLPDAKLDAGQRAASAGNAVIDFIGPFVGGSGTMLKGVAGLAKGVSAAETMAAQAARAAKATTKAGKVGSAARKAMAWEPKSFAGKMAWDVGEEGGEEFVQSIFEDKRGTYNGTGYDRKEWGDGFDLDKALEAGAMGAIGGGIMGGAIRGPRALANYITNNKKKDASKPGDKETYNDNSFVSFLESDEPWVSTYVEEEVKTKENQKAAIVANKAASLVLVADRNMNATTTQTMQQVAGKENVQGNTIGQTAQTAPLTQHQCRVSADEVIACIVADYNTHNNTTAETNGIARNFRLTDEELKDIVIHSNDSQYCIGVINGAIARARANNDIVSVVVEKSPAFNEGPVLLEVVEVVAGDNKLELASQTLPKLTADLDQDTAVVFYDYGEIQNRINQGVRLFGQKYDSYKWTDWTAINKDSFIPSGIQNAFKEYYPKKGEDGTVTKKPFPSMSEFRSQFNTDGTPEQAWFIMLDETVNSINDYIKKETGVDEKLLSTEDIVKDCLDIFFNKEKFDKTFGAVLDKINDRIKENAPKFYKNVQLEQNEMPGHRAYRFQLDAMNYIITQFNAEAQRNQLVEDLKTTSNPILQEVGLNVVEKIAKDPNPLIVRGASSGNVQYSSITQLLVMLRYFSPYFDYKAKNNPIFRSSGAVVMNFQGFNGLATGDAGSFQVYISDLFTAVELASLKQEDYGVQARTVAKTRLQQEVRNVMKDSGPGFLSRKSLSEVEHDFIEAWNKVRDTYKKIVDDRKKSNGSVQQAMEAAIPQEATGDNWIYLFQEAYWNTELNYLFGQQKTPIGGYEHMTLSGLMRKANREQSMFNMNVIQDYIASLDDSQAAADILRPMGLAYREKNVKLEKRFKEIVESDETGALFSRLSYELDAYDRAKNDSNKQRGQRECDRLLGILRKDLDAMHALLGKDFLTALGWMSSSQWVRSEEFKKFAKNRNDRINIIFSGMVKSRLAGLFGVPGKNTIDQKGLFLLYEEAKTDEEKNKALWDIVDYLQKNASISDVYADFAASANAVYVKTRPGDGQISFDQAYSDIVRNMKFFTDTKDVTYEDKQKALRVFDYTGEQDKMSRSILIESMASMSSTVDEIGLGARITRAKQLGASNVYDMLERRRTAIRKWRESVTNEDSARLFIEDTLRNASIDISTVGLASFYFDAGRVTRPQMEKVNVTKGQSWFYGTAAYTSQLRSKTVFQQITESSTSMAINLSQVFYDPRILSDLLRNPDKEISVFDDSDTSSGGFMAGTITGRQVWNALTGIDLKEGSPIRLDDWVNLMETRPELMDLICPMYLKAGLSGDLATVSLVTDENHNADDFGKIKSMYDAWTQDNAGAKKRAESQFLSVLLNDCPDFIAKVIPSVISPHESDDVWSIKSKLDNFLQALSDAAIKSALNDNFEINSDSEHSGLAQIWEVLRTNTNKFSWGFISGEMQVDSIIQEYLNSIRSAIISVKEFGKESSAFILENFETFSEGIFEAMGAITEEPTEEQREKAKQAEQKIEEFGKKFAASFSDKLSEIRKSNEISESEKEDLFGKLKSVVESSIAMDYLLARLEGRDKVDLDKIIRGKTDRSWADIRAYVLGKISQTIGSITDNQVEDSGLKTAITQMASDNEKSRGLAVASIAWIRQSQREEIQNKLTALWESWHPKDEKTGKRVPRRGFNQSDYENDVILILMPILLNNRSTVSAIRINEEAARDQMEITAAFRKLATTLKEARNSGRFSVDELRSSTFENVDTKPFFGGLDILSESAAVMRKRCMDLLAGSGVAMNTGNEGDQYKAMFGIGLLPRYFIEGRNNKEISCSIEPVESEWSKINPEEIKSGNIYVYQINEGKETQVNAKYIPENLRVGVVKWVNKNDCSCGFCATHNGSGTERAIAKSASIMSENLTIKARKVLKTSIEKTIRSYTKDSKYQNPVIYSFDPNSKTPVSLESQIDSLMENHNNIIKAFAKNIKSAAEEIDNVADDMTGLIGHEVQFAKLCNSFIEIMINTQSGTTSQIFTVDEIRSGKMLEELTTMKATGIVRAKQVFLTVDQVGKRILQYVAKQRKAARGKEGTPWSKGNEAEYGDAAEQIQSWAVDAITKASDLRGDRDSKIARHLSEALAKRGPMPNRGDITTDIQQLAMPSSLLNGYLYLNQAQSELDWSKASESVKYTPKGKLVDLAKGNINNVGSILFLSDKDPDVNMNSDITTDIFVQWKARDDQLWNPENSLTDKQRHRTLNDNNSIPQATDNGNTVIVMNDAYINRVNLLNVVKASKSNSKFYFVLPDYMETDAVNALEQAGIMVDTVSDIKKKDGYTWIEMSGSLLKRKMHYLKYQPARYPLTTLFASDPNLGIQGIDWAFVPDSFYKNKSDSTGEIMDDFKKDIGAEYRRPFNVQLPDYVRDNWTVDIHDKLVALSDSEKISFANDCIDQFILYTRDEAARKKAKDYRIQYQQAIVNWVNYQTNSELQKKQFKLGQYSPLCIVRFIDADNNIKYYPVFQTSDAGPNMQVAAVMPAEETGEITIIPAASIASISDEIAIKLYATGAAYKMMTAYGSAGRAWFDCGKKKVAIMGTLYQDALKSRLVGHLNDNMIASVYWHQYQEWMFDNKKSFKLGEKLRSVLDPDIVSKYKEDLIALDNTTGLSGWTHNSLLGQMAVNGVKLSKTQGNRDLYLEDLAHALTRLFQNCANLDINPAFIFNIDSTEGSTTQAARRRCTSRDAAIFAGLDTRDIQTIFNWVTNELGTDEAGKYFCASDGKSETKGDDPTKFHIWGDGFMEITYEPTEGVQQTVKTRVLLPQYLSSGFSTERAAFTTRIHRNMPQDITLALRNGIDKVGKGTLDRVLDWATSETMGLYDDYVNSYVNSFFVAKDTDEMPATEARKITERRLINDFEYRNLSNWYNQQMNENIFDSEPVELYSDKIENKMSRDEAYRKKRELLSIFPSKNNLRMNVTTLDAIYNACMGRAASNNFNNIFPVNIKTYTEVMRIAADRLKRGENPFALDRAELNRIIRISKDGESVKTRYSLGIAPEWAIRDLNACTGWHNTFEDAQKDCIDYAEKMRVKFSQATNNNGFEALKQARALENRISFLMYQNGVETSKLRIYGFASTEDLRVASENVLNVMFSGTERDVAKEKELQEYTRQGYKHLSDRRDERYKKLYTEYDADDKETSIAISNLTFNGSVDQVLKTAATIVRANSLLTIELPMNAVVDKGLNYGLMLWATRNADNGLLGPFAKAARNRVKVSDATIKSTAYNSSVNTIISIAREAAASGRIAEFMAFVQSNPDNLTIQAWQEHMDELNQGSKFDRLVDNAYRKIAKISTAEGFMNQWRNEIWLRRFLEIVGSSEYHADMSQVLPNGRTRFEENLLANPAKAIADMFSVNSLHAEEAFRALNAALKGDMAQDNLISSLFTYVTKNGSTMDFLMATLGFKFLRASVNFSMRVANNIAPVSSINYLLVKLFESGVLEKVPGVGSRLKGFQNEAHRLQIYTDLREAIAVDMAHMSMTAVAALLAMTVGGIEPPEDEDKWPNEGEWTICGFRLSMNWWLKDVLGLTLPLAITWKSALLGKPQMFTLFDSLSDAVMSNPWIKVGDIVSAIVDPDEATNELSEAIEAYSNYPGGAPDGMEYIMGSAGAFGLSYLGQFITPGFVKELTRVLPKWEHSSNKIYAEDITGSNTDPTYRTTLTTFQDAQIRKVTKGNVFLGLLADMFNDTSTGYTVWEMPRQVVADPTQLAFMRHYSIHTEDGGLKDQDEIGATCLELVYLLQAYGDADKLKSAGFYLDYDTRAAVSKLLSDFKTYVKAYYQQVSIDTNDLDPAVLGVGSIIAGSENGKEIVSSYNALIAQIEALHDLLWDDKLTKGLTYYNRYNTTWDEDIYGNIYATGYRDNLAGLLMPFKVAPTTSTAGWDEDWATLSAVTGEPMYDRNGNGLRALIPANIDDWGQKDDDGNVTYSDLYKLLWGKNGFGNSGGSGGYSRRSGGGYSSTPKVYSPSSGTPRLSTPDAQYRFNRPITNVGLNDYYLRPGFETKGSRKAYKREDI